MAIATTTLLIAGLAISAAGAGVSAYSSYQAGQSQKRLNEYNAQLAENEAANQRRDAANQANNIRLQNQRLLAKQRAGFAHNGAVLDTGTPLLIESEQAGYLELGALNTEYTGNKEAGKYQQQATLDRMAGKAAATAGNLNATASILQGVGSVTNGVASGYQSGVFGAKKTG